MDKHFLTCKGIQNLALSLLFLSIFMVFPQSFALASENTKNVEQSDEITLKVDNQPIKNVLALIERKTGYAVGYNANLAGMDRLVSVNWAIRSPGARSSSFRKRSRQRRVVAQAKRLLPPAPSPTLRATR